MSSTQSIGLYPPWAVLIKGCTSFVDLTQTTLLAGPFSVVFDQSLKRMELLQRTFSKDYMQYLRLSVDEKVTDPVRRSIYHEAIHELNQTYGVLHEVKGGNGLVDLFFCIVRVTDLFKFVEDEVLSYFCVLLHKLPGQWWLDGWVNHIMTRIYSSVGDIYFTHLVWPMEQIG